LYIYKTGASVQLTAKAAADSTFFGWGGHDDCAEGQVTLIGNRHCIAYFVLKKFGLTVTPSGSGKGRITSVPVGIHCGNQCKQDYVTNTTVTLTAIPNAGSVFKGWAGDPECKNGQVTLSKATTCKALFETEQLTLTVNKVGAGSVFTTQDAGIRCGSECTATYPQGTQVTLIAKPNPGSVFKAWGEHCPGGTLTLTRATTCTATFVSTPVYDLKVIAQSETGGSGSVITNVGGIKCSTASPPGNCSARYAEHTQITLIATPAADSEFKSWSGGCVPHPNNPKQALVVLTAQTDCTAVFKKSEVINTSNTSSIYLNVAKILGQGNVAIIANNQSNICAGPCSPCNTGTV